MFFLFFLLPDELDRPLGSRRVQAIIVRHHLLSLRVGKHLQKLYIKLKMNKIKLNVHISTGRLSLMLVFLGTSQKADLG